MPATSRGWEQRRIRKGDPIDVVTGRVFTTPVVDLALPGPLPLVFFRTYSTSLRERDIGLGPGWTHTLAWEVELRRSGAVVWTDDGLPVAFGPVEGETAALGPHGWVLHRHGEGLAMDVPDGTRRIFEPRTGDPERQRLRLTALEDRARNRVQLTFNGAALSRIDDAAGRAVRVSTHGARRMVSLDIACPSGRTYLAVSYEYDREGRLICVTDADGYRTTYAYDDGNRLVSYRLPTGLVFYFRYDPQGRGVETWGEREDGGDRCLADGLPEVLRDGSYKKPPGY